VAYVLVMTPEVRAWLHDLRKRDRASANQVGQAIGMLLEAGPELGRPLAEAGDKAGKWETWYRQAIPLAEHRYEDYLKQEDIR